MKKLALLGILFLTVACSSVDRAKENVKEEIKKSDIAIVNHEGGIVYYEDGKVFYKSHLYGTPKEIRFEDVAIYTAKVALK